MHAESHSRKTTGFSISVCEIRALWWWIGSLSRGSFISTLPECKAEFWTNWHVTPYPTVVCVPTKQQAASLGRTAKRPPSSRIFSIDCFLRQQFQSFSVALLLQCRNQRIEYCPITWSKESPLVASLDFMCPLACSLWLMVSCFPESTVSTRDKIACRLKRINKIKDVHFICKWNM